MADPNPTTPLPPLVEAICVRELSSAERAALERAVAAPAPSDAALLLQLIEELAETAPKPAAIGLKKLPGALDTLGPAHAIAWLDLGIALAAQSSTAAQKYFLESPDLLAAVPPERRPRLFALAQDLCDDHYLVVMEFLRAGPDLPEGISPGDLTLWMQTGLRLAEEDRVLAVEYFRISPQVLALLPAEGLGLWVELGKALVAPNTLGKPDYMKVIEYFRLSPETLSAIDPPDLRKPFLTLGHVLARRSPALGMDYLRSAPAAIAEFAALRPRKLFLTKAAEIGSREPSLVMDFLKEGPRMFRALEQSETDFTAWAGIGIDLLAREPERARAYFSGRSKTGQDTTERLKGGTTLASVARVLTLFAEGLSGRSVAVKPTGDIPEEMREAAGDAPTTDGRTIYLPSRIRLFPDDGDNFRVYKIATLHEAGHLQFGTYTPRMELLADEIASVRAAFKNAGAADHEIRTLGDFLRLFPDAGWARFLWTVLEDARVDARLRAEYPGARADMDRLISFELASRPALENLPPREAVREALLQLSMTDTTEAPLSLAEAISEAYRVMQRVKSPGAGPEDALRALARLYPYLEEQLSKFPPVEGESDPLRAKDMELSKDSSPSEGQGGKSMRTSQPAFRGTMHPEWVERRSGEKTVPVNPDRGTPPAPEPARRQPSSMNRMSGGHDAAAGEGRTAPPPGGEGVTRTDAASGPDEKIFFYDEWDQAARE
ncbi:MAG TPA: hypothetical protein VI702_06800, partial [Nitrospiria bacterium]